MQSTEEYKRLAAIEEDYNLLLLAQERIAKGMEHTVPFNEAMADLGISESELNEAEELEIK